MSTEPPSQIPSSIEIYLEPLDADVLPVLWPTRRLTFGRSVETAPPGSPRAGRLRLDPYGDIRHTVPSEIGLPYELQTTKRPDPEKLRAVDSANVEQSPELRPFLQLPDGMRRIEQLARRVTDDDQTPFAKATAIEAFLEAEYSYTTDLPKVDDDRPAEAFLFETKRGHCEYYATAMALMLRSLDIPARVVNGFLGGKWNAVGNYLAVRQGDAHSWVELFVPTYGWVPVDPTPASSVQAESPGPMSWFGETYDALRMYWIRWVIEYDLNSQMEVLKSARRWVSPETNGSPERDEPSSDEGLGIDRRSLLLWTGLAFLCLVALAAARRYDARSQWAQLLVHAGLWSVGSSLWLSMFWGFSGRTAVGGLLAGVGSVAIGASSSFFGRSAGPPSSTRLFERLEQCAERAGIDRHPGEPATAFLGRLEGTVPELREKLRQFRRCYLDVRFGDRTLDPDRRRSMEETIELLEQQLRDDSPDETGR